MGLPTQTQERQRDGLHCYGRAPGATSDGFERPWYCVPFSHTRSGTQSYQLSHPHYHQTEPQGRNRTRGDRASLGHRLCCRPEASQGPCGISTAFWMRGQGSEGSSLGPADTVWQSSPPACRSEALSVVCLQPGPEGTGGSEE